MRLTFPLSDVNHIPAAYRGTPVQDLICYHNVGKPFKTYAKAEILIGMCMDNRKSLRIPNQFAYILRSGGGNLRHSEFKVSYAVAIGGIKAIVLMSHNHCGMVSLCDHKEQFVEGLVHNGGWERSRAEEHFWQFAPIFQIGNEIDFVVSEARRLRARYPNIVVAPLHYQLEDNMLYGLSDDQDAPEYGPAIATEFWSMKG